MGCAQSGWEQHDLKEQVERLSTSPSPQKKRQPVLLGGSPFRRKGRVDEFAAERHIIDTTISFCPYFKVAPGQREEWKRLFDTLREQATEQGAFFYRLTFNEGGATHLQGVFPDAAHMLGHLRACEDMLESLIEVSTLERVEVQGCKEELDKVRREAAVLGECRYVFFELAPETVYAPGPFSSELKPGTGVSIGHYFRIARPDLPMFKWYHAAAFSEKASVALGLERQSFSFSEGLAHLREEFVDADTALRHLQNSAPVHASAMQKSVLFFMEIHGPGAELERLRNWTATAVRAVEAAEQAWVAAGFTKPEGLRLVAADGTVDARAAAEAVAQMLGKATLYDLESSTSCFVRAEPVVVKHRAERSTSVDRRVLFADPPVEEEAEVEEVEELEDEDDEQLGPHHTDTTVSLFAHFRVAAQKFDEWMERSLRFYEAAEDEESMLSCGISHRDGFASLRFTFKDAGGLLSHLRACDSALHAILCLSTKLERVEVHAPRAELKKMQAASLVLSPVSFFELTPDSLRTCRPYSGERGSDLSVTVGHYFKVRGDMAAFKRAHCSGFCAEARDARGLEQHAFSFGKDAGLLRQSFVSARAAIRHLQLTAAAHAEAFNKDVSPFLELHGPAKQVEELRTWAAAVAVGALVPEEGSESAGAVARTLSKATVYVHDGRSIRRTFTGMPPPADQRLATAATLNMSMECAAPVEVERQQGWQQPPALERPPTMEDAPPSSEFAVQVEHFDLGEGRCIERCGRSLSVVGADSKEEADELITLWQRQQGRGIPGQALAGPGTVKGGWCC